MPTQNPKIEESDPAKEMAEKAAIASLAEAEKKPSKTIEELRAAIRTQETLRELADVHQENAEYLRARTVQENNPATTRSSAYLTVLFTPRQISYLLGLLNNQVTDIAAEIRVKLESA